ncbi:hypothetical protein N0V88_003449 [Collariella sp. IMI 366227]|nr:hypothetical protein N0V88_003449 [Collariella sp. IMI 366227]
MSQPTNITDDSWLNTGQMLDEPLDERHYRAFSVILKPKRFFCFGRIFKTIWFDASSSSETPVARYRWFVVVRRRAQRSLCFNITTYKVQGSSGTRAPCGMRSDYVVLHSANIEPPRPYEAEGITKDPIAIIIEGREQFVAPVARLDCGRVFTVEDSMKVMKVGRVHPGSIGLLEEYYTECVL